MPVYCYKCPNCGRVYNYVMTIKEMEGRQPLYCIVCLDKYHNIREEAFIKLYRDYMSEGCNFIFGNNNICRASTGYARNIDEAEEWWRKNPKDGKFYDPLNKKKRGGWKGYPSGHFDKMKKKIKKIVS